MKSFEIQESEKGKGIWIYPEADGEFEAVAGEPEEGRLAICLRYVSPREREILTRKMISNGILKRRIKRGQDFTDVAQGREFDRDRMYAEAFISDWKGFLKDGVSIPYSPQAAAEAMAKSLWLNRLLADAVDELERFFGRNGHAS